MVLILLCAKWTLLKSLKYCLPWSQHQNLYMSGFFGDKLSQRIVLFFNVYLHRIMLSNRIKERWVLRVYTKQCMNKKTWKFEVVGIAIPKTAKILRVQQWPILKSPPRFSIILQKYKLFNWNELQESVILWL